MADPADLTAEPLAPYLRSAWYPVDPADCTADEARAYLGEAIKDVNRLADALDAALEREQQARDALTRYGDHDPDCPGNACEDRSCCPCDCGWDAARRALTDLP